ncbi:MAG: hypothetical protein ACJAWL_002243 [Motiliproteus sp.]|jgi:hypothetical protein
MRDVAESHHQTASLLALIRNIQMTHLKLKLNSAGEIDLPHYQRVAEQARAEAIHDLFLSLGHHLKQLVNSVAVRVRAVRLGHVLLGTKLPGSRLPGSMLRHSH